MNLRERLYNLEKINTKTREKLKLILPKSDIKIKLKSYPNGDIRIDKIRIKTESINDIQVVKIAAFATPLQLDFKIISKGKMLAIKLKL